MHWSGFAARRAGSRAGLLAAATLVVAISSGALSAILGTVGSNVADAQLALIDDAIPTDAAVRIATRLQDDAGAQDAEVADSVATAIGTAPLTTVRSTRTSPLPAVVDGREATVVLGTEADVENRIALTAGSLPTAPDQVAVSADAAGALGVASGDTIVVAGLPLVVSGLWTPVDPADPLWFGDPAVGSGRSGDAAGPLLVDDSLYAQLDTRPTVRWTIVPSDDFTASDIPAASRAIPRLDAETARLGSGSTDAWVLQGGLGSTLARASVAGGGVSGAVGVPVLLLIVLGGIVIGVVGGALASSRDAEAVLVRGRGLAAGQSVGLAVVEALVVSVVGAAIGVSAALLLPGSELATVLVTGGATALAAVLLLTATAALHRAGGVRSQDAGRAAAVAGLAPAVVAVVLAVISGAQFLATGAPVVVGRDGAVRVDPLALAAPAIVLVALTLIARLIATPLLFLIERAASTARGLLPVLPARQLARRTRTVASALLVVALGAGALTFAAYYAGSAVTSDSDATRLATAGDVRVVFTIASSEQLPSDSDPVADYAALAGVDDALGVTLVTASVGSDAIPFLAADPVSVAALDPLFAPIGGFAEPLEDASAPGVLPIVVTDELATRLGVGLGDQLSIVTGSLPTGVDAFVVGVVDMLPVTGDLGILVDPGAFDAAVAAAQGTAPLVNEVWLTTDDPASVITEARAVTARPADFVSAPSVSVAGVLEVGILLGWVGALAALLLAFVGFAGVASGLQRDRRGEQAPLRSLGFGPAQQGRARALELGLTAISAVVLGVAVGALAAAFAVPALTGGFSVALAGWIAGVATLIVGLAAISLVAALRTRAAVARGERR